MGPKKVSHKKFKALHSQAEKLLTLRGDLPDSSLKGDPLKLLHELQTLQIELELQNEELRYSQQQLEESKIRYTQLYDSAPVGYLTTCKKGIIQKLNLPFADMVSRQKKAILKKPLSAFIVPEDQDIYYRHLRDLADSKTRQVCELALLKKDGTSFDAQLESGIISDDSKADRYLIIISDISKRKAALKEKEALEAKLLQAEKMETLGNLVGGIAHDFNNILSMIIGSTELALQDTPERHPVHTYLEYIREAGFKASGIVRQLLNFSRTGIPELKPVNAVLIVKETLKFLRSTIPSTIEIISHLPDKEITLHADTVQFNQVLINICINAGHAMEASGGTLTISLEEVNLTKKSVKVYPGLFPGQHLKIRVEDTGCGIAPEIMDKIFDPYFTTREMEKGSGMGLAVVHGIVQNHKGAVSVKSKPDKGSVFTIIFPVVDEKPDIKTETTDQQPGGTESILFIDDEPTITKVTGKILEKLGYRVEALLDPVDALEIFQSKPDRFDMVVTDMTMPHMTGIGLSENIRKVRPDIPIIICTGNSALIDEKKTEELDIAAYLVKPITIPKIAEIIRKVFDD